MFGSCRLCRLWLLGTAKTPGGQDRKYRRWKAARCFAGGFGNSWISHTDSWFRWGPLTSGPVVPKLECRAAWVPAKACFRFGRTLSMHSLCGCLKGECQEHQLKNRCSRQNLWPVSRSGSSAFLIAWCFNLLYNYCGCYFLRRIAVSKLSISSYQKKSFSERFCCDSVTEAQLRF